MRRCLVPIIASLLCLNASQALAEAGRTDDTASQTSTAQTGMAVMPQRGLTMDEVVRYYGQPLSKKAPVGQPPISRWYYDGFVVVFEQNYVIHAIAE